MSTTIQEIASAIEKGKAKLISELIPRAIEEGLSAETILDEGLLAGMSVIGDRFTRNEAFIPEVLVSARAMNKGVELIKPLLAADGAQCRGKVCIGTVKGDLHDIGKNLVKLMLESKNFEVIDLGVDVAPEVFAQTAREQSCELICCSALLTTSMEAMAQVVEEVKKAGIRDEVIIMVGGAPVTEEFCRKIGADAYTPDSNLAALKALELLENKHK